ncbi:MULTISPECIES: hypothetical protein [Dolichospermum]|jgi:hypothetical protein|uniref:Uncharacterized protein n=1 Tax=Dolichospermum heterosporum TAC447 TaxID=747523 RepID=A0ABY5LX70_9CYAN|nr:MULTISPECIES: hypothetical protein [Dolichospermum]MBE9257250.1 hypothetical protein [Dolichospermum sp. LEGE 00246]UUO15342.1 hypothetical protein NG743_25685 [Dolichospermum heterosporum TAC447]
MPKDWLEWHDLYNSEAKLQQRLEIVREYISYSLDNSPTGTIRVVSACAGDGRDLLGTLGIHRYLGENLPTPKEEKLFVFSGVPNKAR